MQQIQSIQKTVLNKQRLSLLPALLLLAALFLGVIVPQASAAGQLTARKLTLGSSAGAASTTWAFTFSPTEATALNGISFEVCDAASGTCNTPGSWSDSGAAYSSLTYNGSGQAGWALDNTSGMLRIKNNSSAAAVTGPVVANFTTVTNPSTTNETFYVRILTYSGDDFTTQVDNGVVAASTSQQLTLTGTMDETLVFCTGTSITGTDCGTVAGSAVNFGSFSSTASSTGTSVMAASTNAGSGYSITTNGNTLTCASCPGTPTIGALAAQTASTTGSAQFGSNLRNNATPDIGADPSGSGSGSYTANYGTADQYRFVTGDPVASAAGATNANAYTVSYIVNVPGNQAAGSYSAILNYICTATY
jgi:hypothetical protein